MILGSWLPGRDSGIGFFPWSLISQACFSPLGGVDRLASRLKLRRPISTKVFSVVAGQFSRKNCLGQHVYDSIKLKLRAMNKKTYRGIRTMLTDESEPPLAMARIFLDMSLLP